MEIKNQMLFNVSELDYYELEELSAIYNAICSIIDAPAKSTRICALILQKKRFFLD